MAVQDIARQYGQTPGGYAADSRPATSAHVYVPGTEPARVTDLGKVTDLARSN